MAKLSKDFFLDDEVLIMGYPLQADPSMKMILKAFLDNGITVYAFNSKATGDVDIKIYTDFSQLPKVPKTVYNYIHKNDTDPWIPKMANAGVTRVLFHSKKDVEQRQLDECEKLGIQTAVACPMMLLGRGFHRFHALLAGVR